MYFLWSVSLAWCYLEFHGSVICCLILTWGKFLSHNCFNCSFCFLLLFFSFWFSCYVKVAPFVVLSQFLNFFFFSLLNFSLFIFFSWEVVCCPTLRADPFLSSVQSAKEPIKGAFIYFSVFDFKHCFKSFFRISISLLTLSTNLHVSAVFSKIAYF